MEIAKIRSFNVLNLEKSKESQRDIVRDIKSFIYNVNSEIKASQKLKKEFLDGKNIPVYEIMIQSQKAKISLELLTKLRDEALKAYNNIINMRL